MQNATDEDLLDMAIAEAKRFLKLAELAKAEGAIKYNCTHAMRAMAKRASMDLTKHLAWYRKGSDRIRWDTQKNAKAAEEYGKRITKHHEEWLARQAAKKEAEDATK